MSNIMTRRAALLPASFDEAALTVEATISTFSPVQRHDQRGGYTERLDPAGLDTSRLVGAPVLDGHRQGSARDTIGVVTAFRMDGASLVAAIRLLQSDDVKPIVDRIRQGVIRGVSIGCRVSHWKESLDPVTKARTRTAAAWQIFEASAVPVPADPGATFRSHVMENEISETMSEEQAINIRSIGQLADLPPSWAEGQIAINASEAEARQSARDELVLRSQTTPRIRVVSSHEEPAAIMKRETDALIYRAAGGELPEASRPYVDQSFRDIAVSALHRVGISTRGLSTDEIFQRAAMGTSDFPLVVSNAANKIALDRYAAASSALTPLFRQRNLRDFKPSHAIRMGELGELKPLTEQGEIQHTSRVENGEAMQLGTYAEGLNVSRKLLINDDANLFGDITSALADAAAATVANKLAGLVTNPGKLSDNKNVFHADRGNLANPAAALGDAGASVLALSEGRQAMRTVKGLDGKTLVGASPKYLVVGPSQETIAEQLLTDLYAATVGDVNPFSNRLTLLVEPRIADDRWFLFADPARLPCLQMAYLSGAPGVQIQRTEAWDTLGMRFRAYLDFGCGWTDWRGAYKGN
jgi:phage head maturation protease